jgi:hypothetical protein
MHTADEVSSESEEQTLGTRARIEWPEGKAFAFTVFDDTDLATVENVAPVYESLGTLGLRTTKSVWAIRGAGTPVIGGSTGDDPEYLAWTRDLQAGGFEIASHGATYVTSPRDVVIRSLERFRELYGHYPVSLANHSGCADSIYWGPDRVTGVNRLAYNVLTRFSRDGVFMGHREGDPLFWGDICRSTVKYVRNFTFRDINTLAACPWMPYHDPARPFVTRWFASSEGADVDAFVRCVSEANQDRLEAEGGACIMYTHFAAGFVPDGKLDRRFESLMRRLARKNGWFVPVATLLDHLEAQNGERVITSAERSHLERRWLLSKLRVGYS